MTRDVQHDLDELGVAKTAREEKARMRDAEMAKLYRKHVLHEPDQPEFVALSEIKPLQPGSKKEEEVGSFGD